jgi:hypothetical protein
MFKSGTLFLGCRALLTYTVVYGTLLEIVWKMGRGFNILYDSLKLHSTENKDTKDGTMYINRTHFIEDLISNYVY